MQSREIINPVPNLDTNTLGVSSLMPIRNVKKQIWSNENPNQGKRIENYFSVEKLEPLEGTKEIVNKKPVEYKKMDR